MTLNVNSIRITDVQVEFAKGKLLLLESTPKKSAEKRIVINGRWIL